MAFIFGRQGMTPTACRTVALAPLLLLLLASSHPADAVMYDVISPKLLAPEECPHGCAAWSKTNTPADWWQHGAVPAGASNHCAQPANATGLATPKPVLDPKGIGGQGAWCVCEGMQEAGWLSRGKWGYCTSASYIPEQINLQLANPDTVVVSFVTFEPTAPEGLPVAMLSKQAIDDGPALSAAPGAPIASVALSAALRSRNF